MKSLRLQNIPDLLAILYWDAIVFLLVGMCWVDGMWLTRWGAPL